MTIRGNIHLEEEYLVLLYEFKHGLESYLKNSTENKKTLKEIIDFNEKYAEKVMPFFGQEIFYAALEASEDHSAYFEAKETFKRGIFKTLDLMNQYNIDAFIGLTRGPAWKINYQGGDNACFARSSVFW